MKGFVVKILLSLLFIALVTSSIVAESRLHKEYKSGEEDHDHSDKTSTHKHRNQDGTVIGEEDHERSSKTSSYKDYNQDDAEVRAVGPQMVFNNPNQPCYTQFFAGGQQPTGLRTGQNLQNIRYICQMVNQQTYYGTMFDQALGIAVFSAYTLTQANANFPNRPRPTRWTQTPGILKQGSDAIYLHQQFDKGHLVPGATYSNTQDSLLSTFVYTNAVPQRPTFNRGQWSRFERRIRVYAQQCTQGPQPGTLYLITGTAFGHIQNNPLPYNPQVPINQLGPAGNNPAIDIPNSMWTAGCCVHPNGIESFAVIGNNLPNRNQILTQQIPVARLQDILEDDVNNRNIGGPNVDLFPGNGACSNVINNLPNLPQGIGG